MVCCWFGCKIQTPAHLHSSHVQTGRHPLLPKIHVHKHKYGSMSTNADIFMLACVHVCVPLSQGAGRVCVVVVW